jgi:plastocyanin
MRLPALLLLVLVLGACGRDDAPSEGPDAPAGAGTVALTAPASNRGDVHIVRLVARGDRYAFEPAEVAARQGDVIRFVQTGFQPEAVEFDLAAAPGGAAEFFAREGLAGGPLLTEPGVFYDVALRDAPPGEYRFYSVPHREHGMQGRLVVEE